MYLWYQQLGELTQPISPHLHGINTGERVFRLTGTSRDRSGQPLAPSVLSILYNKPVLFGKENSGPLPHIDFFIGMTVSVHQGNSCVETVGIGNGTRACIIGVWPLGALNSESCVELQVQLPVGSKHSTSKVFKPTVPITHLLLQLPHDAPKSWEWMNVNYTKSRKPKARWVCVTSKSVGLCYKLLIIMRKLNVLHSTGTCTLC